MVINNAFARGFGALDADKQVKQFKVTDSEKKELVNVPRRAFATLAKRTLRERSGAKVKAERTELRVFKVVFGAGPKWDFYYSGHKISATIADESFMKKVSDGERFGRGDSLDVDLEIVREFDRSIGSYINRQYNVIKVHRHSPKGRQGEFDFER